MLFRKRATRARKTAKRKEEAVKRETIFKEPVTELKSSEPVVYEGTRPKEVFIEGHDGCRYHLVREDHIYRYYRCRHGKEIARGS